MGTFQTRFSVSIALLVLCLGTAFTLASLSTIRTAFMLVVTERLARAWDSGHAISEAANSANLPESRPKGRGGVSFVAFDSSGSAIWFHPATSALVLPHSVDALPTATDFSD